MACRTWPSFAVPTLAPADARWLTSPMSSAMAFARPGIALTNVNQSDMMTSPCNSRVRPNQPPRGLASPLSRKSGMAARHSNQRNFENSRLVRSRSRFQIEAGFPKPFNQSA
jgi:hypothetical protein